jgi:hypothetical protein
MKDLFEKLCEFLNIHKRYKQAQVHKEVLYVLQNMAENFCAAGLNDQTDARDNIIRKFYSLARFLAIKKNAPQETFDTIFGIHFVRLCSYSGPDYEYKRFLIAELLELASHLNKKDQEKILSLFIRLGFAKAASSMCSKMNKGNRSLDYSESMTLASSIVCNQDDGRNIDEAIFLKQNIKEISTGSDFIVRNVGTVLAQLKNPAPKEISPDASESMGGMGSSN